MAGMQRVVEVHTGQHREDVGLQERDEQFEGVEADGHQERQHRDQLGRGRGGGQQHDDEAARTR